MTEKTDADLAALALAGSQPAYGELLRRHRGPVYRLVRSHVGDTDEAIDVVQESFVAAFASLARYDSNRPFRHWINRIAINKCRDWGRRRTVRRLLRFALPLDAAHAVADQAVTGEVAIDDARALARAASAMAALPNTLKEPLILTAIEGMSQAEAANLLGISEKAVETRIARARKALVARLATAS